MGKLSRQDFVAICTAAIMDTRKKVVIQNQISGYKTYHAAVRDRKYLKRILRPAIRAGKNNNRPFMYRHALIKKAGIGNCHELARFLLIEVARRVRLAGGNVKLRVVASKEYDHGYLKISTHLLNENKRSTWEVDAWDPRIIDRSKRPDGSIKNYTYLRYGAGTKTLESIRSENIDFTAIDEGILPITIPVKGAPKRSPTPERAMIKKHRWLYSDMTVETAEKKGEFDRSGKIRYCQKVSTWQRSERQTLWQDYERKASPSSISPADKNIPMIPQDVTLERRYSL